VRLDRANDPDTNVFGVTQYFMYIQTHLKQQQQKIWICTNEIDFYRFVQP